MVGCSSLAGMTEQELRTIWGNGNLKGREIRWLLLPSVDALEKDAIMLKVTNRYSFGSVGHSNQSRKRSKRNPDRKRRSETLTVCR